MNTLEVNNFKCQINTPEAIKDKTESAHSLPPYAIADVYLVDEYPGCPENWMHGSKNVSSYFMSVKENSGLWFDFNSNTNDHDIAVVISIQGVNPITGQKTDKIKLEQYGDKCPVHQGDFLQDRFCKSCGYKWPKQNYITTASTPKGLFWLDGFRNPDGTVRQYVFTKEQLRGVANNLIGEDRVFAIGIAFYKSKTKKINNSYFYEKHTVAKPYKPWAKPVWYYDQLSSPTCDSDDYIIRNSIKSCSVKTHKSKDEAMDCLRGINGYSGTSGCSGSSCSIDNLTMSSEVVEVSENFEVGAGAKINQNIYDDVQELSYYEETPSGMIYINYACKKDINNILKLGKRKEVKDGFLANIPTGN